MRKIIVATLACSLAGCYLPRDAHAGSNGYMLHLAFDGVETGVTGDPMHADQPFKDEASCQAWLSMAIMMAASQNPERAKAMRLECKPA